jgi:hypothetical protein
MFPYNALAEKEISELTAICDGPENTINNLKEARRLLNNSFKGYDLDSLEDEKSRLENKFYMYGKILDCYEKIIGGVVKDYQSKINELETSNNGLKEKFDKYTKLPEDISELLGLGNGDKSKDLCSSIRQLNEYHMEEINKLETKIKNSMRRLKEI